jgi:hypothetical protein
LRHPFLDQRRQRRLHDRDAETHRGGGGVERQEVRRRAAPGGGERGDHHADSHRKECAEPRDQQRARYGGEREHHQRQADQHADLRLGHMKIVVNHRDHRRHRQDRDAQRDAREPEQRERRDQPDRRAFAV